MLQITINVYCTCTYFRQQTTEGNVAYKFIGNKISFDTIDVSATAVAFPSSGCINGGIMLTRLEVNLEYHSEEATGAAESSTPVNKPCISDDFT